MDVAAMGSDRPSWSLGVSGKYDLTRNGRTGKMMSEENVLPKMTWPTTSTRLHGSGVGGSDGPGAAADVRMIADET